MIPPSDASSNRLIKGAVFMSNNRDEMNEKDIKSLASSA